MARIRSGMGRVEYLANKDLIHDLLRQGYTLVSIHEKLKEKGKLTLSYSTLNGLVKPPKRKSKKKKSDLLASDVIQTLEEEKTEKQAPVNKNISETQIIAPARKKKEFLANAVAEEHHVNIIKPEKETFGHASKEWDSDDVF